ncbi:MAG: nascent polypeptide-associated complex protein [Candidatus Aenigmarchaeota archaeon]|nr:nascent polypeptide-associated complex protein [Candidatus Aenigmarchaeota archaeon]
MNINPRQIEKAMKRMGMQAVPIEAEEVIIRTPDKDIVISNPQVTNINMMGQQTYQVVGEAEEKPRSRFSDEDVRMVMEKAGVGEAEAKTALDEEGDIASAILKLKK